MFQSVISDNVELTKENAELKRECVGLRNIVGENEIRIAYCEQYSCRCRSKACQEKQMKT